MKMNPYISNASRLLQQIWQDQNVTIIEKQIQFNRCPITIIDIELNGHHTSLFYDVNIRKGLALIETDTIYWLRKSMTASYLLQANQLESWENSANNQTNSDLIRSNSRKISRNSNDKRAKTTYNKGDYIYEKLNEIFNKNKKVQIIKGVYMGGDSVQISYNYEFNAWVICYKNVSILAKDQRSLHLYQQDNRYENVKMISKIWLKMVQKLTNNLYIELQKQLDGSTIIGYPQFKNSKENAPYNIIFYGMVINNSDAICVCPMTTKRILQKYNLKFIGLDHMGKYTKTDFYSTLRGLHRRVSVEKKGEYEGIILYIMNRQYIVDIFRIEITEVQILNHIEEISQMKNVNHDVKDSFRNRWGKFVAHKDINYYIDLLDKALQCKHNKIPLPHQSIPFLCYALQFNLDLKAQGQNIIRNSSVMKQIADIPFSCYQSLKCPISVVYVPITLEENFIQQLTVSLENKLRRLTFTLKKIKSQLSTENHVVKDIAKQILQWPSKYQAQRKNQNTNQKIQDNNQEQAPPYFFIIENTQMLPNIIVSLEKQLKTNEKGRLHKVIALIEEGSLLKSQYNKYPISVAGIYSALRKKHNPHSFTIQQKIEKLQPTVKIIKNMKNMEDLIQVQKYHLPMMYSSYYAQIEDKCSKVHNELTTILIKLIEGDDQKGQNYWFCRLIVKLELEMKEQNNQLEQYAYHIIANSFRPMLSVDFCQL